MGPGDGLHAGPKSAINGPAMQDFYAKKPNFQTAGKQLAMVRGQDVARVFVPNGLQILQKGLDRITVNKEASETVMKDIAAGSRRKRSRSRSRCRPSRADRPRRRLTRLPDRRRLLAPTFEWVVGGLVFFLVGARPLSSKRKCDRGAVVRAVPSTENVTGVAGLLSMVGGVWSPSSDLWG